jgi:tetratricopeptide (TPR) repeat protein
MSHSLRLIRTGSDIIGKTTEDMQELKVALWQTGSAVASSIGDIDTALTYINDRILIMQRLYDETGIPDGRLCSAYSEKATGLIAKDQLQDVLSLLDKSIILRRQIPGFEREQLFNALRGKGFYYMAKGETLEAVKYFKEALKDREDKYGIDDQRNIRQVSSAAPTLSCILTSVARVPSCGILAMPAMFKKGGQRVLSSLHARERTWLQQSAINISLMHAVHTKSASTTFAKAR